VAKTDPEAIKREKRKNIQWVVTIFVTTILISGTISLISDEVMAGSNVAVAFCILLAIIFLGILFDIIGMAVATADEKPFHSMAARKMPGAQEAIKLLRNAERVSSICNDVIGDICGVVSGSAAATIAGQILAHFTFTWPQMIMLIMSALVAGLTVGGKAVGKTFAINSCTKIIYQVGKMIWRLRRLFPSNRKKK